MARLTKKGPEQGADYAEALRTYLAEADEIPVTKGKRGVRVNITELVKRSGVPRASFYRNKACKDLAAEALGTHRHIEVIDDEALDGLRRKISKLERDKSDLLAQVYGLDGKLQRFRHIEELVDLKHADALDRQKHVKNDDCGEEDDLRRRLAKLERANSELVTQIYEMRRKLQRLQHFEGLVERGRI